MIMNSPEPMSLGSPSQSPPNVNQYMPQFLLGDLASSTQNMQLNSRNPNQGSSKYWMNSNSPPRNTNNPMMNSSGQYMQQNFNMNSGGSSARNYSGTGYDSKMNSDRVNPNYHHYGSYMPGGPGSYTSPTLDRSLQSTTIMGGNLNLNEVKPVQVPPGAPPINRLVDILNNKQGYNPNMSNCASNLISPNDSLRNNNKLNIENDYYGAGTCDKTDLSFTPNVSSLNRINSPPSPNQVDPFYTYGDSIKMDDKLDDTWVTIFGFPQSATSYVLQEFSIYGQIIRHVPNNQGNWLHVQYSNKLQAQKALSKNGKVLANQLMVGVMPCIDKRVMGSNSISSEQSSAVSPNSSSSKPTGLSRNFSAGSKLDRTQSLRTTSRPLGPFNGPREARTTESLLQSGSNMQDPNLPKKNANVISKAMEYMFGW